MKVIKFLSIGFFICLFIMLGIDQYEVATNEPTRIEYMEGPVVDHYYSYKYSLYFKDSQTGKVYRVEHSNSRCRISNDRYHHTKEGDYIKIKKMTYSPGNYEYEIWYNGKLVDLRVSTVYEK